MKRHDNVTSAWIELLDLVMNHEHRSAPRGQGTRERLGTRVWFPIKNNIVLSGVRDLNYKFMIAEWLWIQTGREDVASLDQYNKEVKRFSDDGVIYNGAYGPRLASQWDYLLGTLRKDRDSRQAVAPIFTPCPKESKDIPCTVAFQVFIRNEKLYAIMTMRSNDLFLGFPYDVYNFSQLANALAGELGVDTGDFCLQAGSSHVYDRDEEKVLQILREPFGYLSSPRLPGLCRNPAILTNEFYDGTVYEEYALALRYPTKAQALNVLRRLSQDA